MPCFAGNASFMQVQNYVDNTQCIIGQLPIHVLFDVQYFERFMQHFFPINKRAPTVTDNLFLQFKSSMWENYRLWFGIIYI